MRNLIVIFVLLFFSSLAMAQRTATTDRKANSSSGNTHEEHDESESLSLESEIYSWQLVNQFSEPDSFKVDTTTINFHNYNPIFKKSISNNYLGYAGAPYESNIFFNRERDEPFYFLQSFRAYNKKITDISYYNTTTPYASLFYEQIMGESEQNFDAFFTRNIDSLSNFGFNFHVLENLGQYNNQSATHKNINFFASRNTERYNAYLTLIKGTNNLKENGGFVDQSSISSLARFNLPNGIESLNNSFSFFSSFEYLMGQIPFLEEMKTDTIKKEFKPKYAAQYSIEFNRNSRQIIEKSVNSTYFDTIFIKNSNHTDSVRFNKFSQIFQLKALENDQRRFSFGKRVFVENEIVKAVHPLSYGLRNYTYSNLYLGGEIYKRSSNILNWSVNARFAALGRNIGDALLEGVFDKPIYIKNDTTMFKVKGWYRDISANIFQEHWFSNHYKWENNFKKQHELVARASYSYPRFKLNAGADYALYSNYIYNNQLAVPDQYDGEFLIMSGWLNKDITFWRFVWSNKIVWQQLSNDAVLRLPTWSFYSSINYSHYLFEVMKIQLGAEIYYNSTFNADFYNPTTSQFYIQDEYSTGGITNFNLYANAKLKRTSAFAMLSNVNRNYLYRVGEDFSSPLYPIESIVFRFGFFWTFYN